MKKLFTILTILSVFGFAGYAFSAPTATYERNIYPATSSTYEIGTSTRSWAKITSDQFCLSNGSCAITTFGDPSLWYVTSTILNPSSTLIFTTTSVSGLAVWPYTHVTIGSANHFSDATLNVLGNVYVAGGDVVLSSGTAKTAGGFKIYGQENAGFFLGTGASTSISTDDIAYLSSPANLKILVGMNNASNTVAASWDSFGATTLDPSQGFPIHTLPTTTLYVRGNTNVSGTLYTDGNISVNLHDVGNGVYQPYDKVGTLSVYGPLLTPTSTYGKSGYLQHNGTSFIIGGLIGNQILQLGNSTSSNPFSEQAYFLNGVGFAGGLQSGYNWYVSSTKKMALDNTGNFGIGDNLNLNLTNTTATNPIDAKVMIQTPDNTPLLNLKNSAGTLLTSFTTTSTLFGLNGTNVGIGTDFPSSTVHVYSPNRSALSIQTASTTDYAIFQQATPNQAWRWVVGDSLGGSGPGGYLLQDGNANGGNGLNYLDFTTSTFEIFNRDNSGLPFFVNSPTTTFNGKVNIQSSFTNFTAGNHQLSIFSSDTTGASHLLHFQNASGTLGYATQAETVEITQTNGGGNTNLAISTSSYTLPAFVFGNTPNSPQGIVTNGALIVRDMADQTKTAGVYGGGSLTLQDTSGGNRASAMGTNWLYLGQVIGDSTNAYTAKIDLGSAAFTGRLAVGFPSNTTLSTTTVLSINGSVSFPVLSRDANTTLSDSNYFVNITTNSVTTTLPTAVGKSGRMYVIKNSGTGVVTVATTASETIDGQSAMYLGVQYESLSVISDGTNWLVY